MAEKDRIFSKEQLEEFSKDFMGLAMEALEEKDIEKAKGWIRRHDATKDAIHDLYLHWITALLSHIYDNWGEDAAVKAVKDTATQGQSGWALPIMKAKDEIMKENGLKGYIEWIVDLWRQHSMYPGTTFEEDDEKIILKMKQCGSGGRLINMGAYEGPFAYRKLKKPGHTLGVRKIFLSIVPTVHGCTRLRRCFTVVKEHSFGYTHHLSPKIRAIHVSTISTKIRNKSPINTMKESG